MYRIMLVVVSCGIAALAVAQETGFEAARDVAADELSKFRAVVNNDAIQRPPSELDLLIMCAGGQTEYGYVDTSRDGFADTLRTLGSDMVTADQWRQAGSRLLRPLRNRATLRAQGAAAQAMAVHVAVSNGLLDEYAADLDALDMSQSDRESFRAQASQVLRGATVSGTRLISLDGDGGVCLIVRYDVPLSTNRLPTLETMKMPSRTEDARREEHELPAPGSVGDF